MSASLVGSEMCIRDRFVPLHQDGQRPAEPAPPPRQVDARDLHDLPVPVSYTHLTLPTICSV
eukprot:12136976-Alexandrium_andersonii.AAC.1